MVPPTAAGDRPVLGCAHHKDAGLFPVHEAFGDGIGGQDLVAETEGGQSQRECSRGQSQRDSLRARLTAGGIPGRRCGWGSPGGRYECPRVPRCTAAAQAPGRHPACRTVDQEGQVRRQTVRGLHLARGSAEGPNALSPLLSGVGVTPYPTCLTPVPARTPSLLAQSSLHSFIHSRGLHQSPGSCPPVPFLECKSEQDNS